MPCFLSYYWYKCLLDLSVRLSTLTGHNSDVVGPPEPTLPASCSSKMRYMVILIYYEHTGNRRNKSLNLSIHETCFSIQQNRWKSYRTNRSHAHFSNVHTQEYFIATADKSCLVSTWHSENVWHSEISVKFCHQIKVFFTTILMGPHMHKVLNKV